MQRIAFSSEFYYIKAVDLKKLPQEDIKFPIEQNDDLVVFLKPDGTAALIDKDSRIKDIADDTFIKTKIAYYSYPLLISIFLCMIKPIKRHFYQINETIFTVRLQDIISAKLPRGERNAENAYQWNNKKWQISNEAAQKRYENLRQSMQKKGYDMKSPMFVMLNRKLGAKDQLLQGHHRIGICKELGIKEVSITFWAAPATTSYLKRFI